MYMYMYVCVYIYIYLHTRISPWQVEIVSIKQNSLGRPSVRKHQRRNALGTALAIYKGTIRVLRGIYEGSERDLQSEMVL